LDLAADAVRRANPVRDPGRENARASAGVCEPAVVPARNLGDERGLRWLVAIDERVRGLIGEIDVVRARERRRLAALVVTSTAAILAADVLPEADAECLNVCGCRRRSRSEEHTSELQSRE